MMDYKSSIYYHDALEWLVDNYDEFPSRVIAGDSCKEVSNRIFKDWRWVLSTIKTLNTLILSLFTTYSGGSDGRPLFA